MKWFICKNTTLPHDPRIESPIEVREIADKDMKAFTDYCVKNNLHAYGESYSLYFANGYYCGEIKTKKAISPIMKTKNEVIAFHKKFVETKHGNYGLFSDKKKFIGRL